MSQELHLQRAAWGNWVSCVREVTAQLAKGAWGDRVLRFPMPGEPEQGGISVRREVNSVV